MAEKTSIKSKMWRILQDRVIVTYDDLQELAGASRSYAQEWMATLIKRGVVIRLSGGRYRLDNDACPRDGKRQFDPNTQKESITHEVSRGNKGHKPVERRSEYRVWLAICELKRFKLSDLREMKIANSMLLGTYVSMLVRAGVLKTSLDDKKKRGQYQGRYEKIYTLTRKIDRPPLLSRVTFIYIPDTGEYFGTEKEDFSEMKWPGDVDAS